MTQLNVKNLEPSITEKDFQKELENKKLRVDAIQMKDGYALVDCPDQEAADEVVDALAGSLLNGLTLQVEPAASASSMRNSDSGTNSTTPPATTPPTNTATRLLIKNIPQPIVKETVKELLSSYGEVKDLFLNGEGVATVTYFAPDQAQQAKEKLDEFEFQGAKLKVDYVYRKPAHKTPGAIHNQEFPLRVIVPHQYVGAIIGRAGQTIRAITTKTNARVDVVRRDNNMSAEKVQMVLILAAQVDNSIEACKEILKVIAHEISEAKNKGAEPETSDLELRVLAHNNLCGRLIGRQGIVIKGIMSQTGTRITVSNMTNANQFNPDRIVSIHGDLDSMCAAAEKVYVKLKAAFESDLASMRFEPMYYHGSGQHGMMMGGNAQGSHMQPWAYRGHHQQHHPMAPHHPAMLNYSGGNASGGYSPHMGYNNSPHQPQEAVTCFLYIPKAAVGAVIGTKGSFINHVKSESRASCQVQEKPDSPDSTERAVIITGYPEATWKAQWYLFDKVRSGGFAAGDALRCDILVPRVMVGRIIGKGGQNIRDIQNISGATIKLPDDPQSEQPEEVPVQIFGNIFSQTLSQALIRQLLSATSPMLLQGMPQRGGPGGHHSGMGGGRSGGPHHHHAHARGGAYQGPQHHHHHHHQGQHAMQQGGTASHGDGAGPAASPSIKGTSEN